MKRIDRKAVPLALWFLLVIAPGVPSQESSAGLQIFDRVWRAVSERYYDRRFNGVDWTALRDQLRPQAGAARDRADLYRVLRSLLASLGDAHTRIYAPDEGYDRERPAGITVGVIVRRVEGQAVVTSVDPDSEAARAGIRPGFRLVKVNGRDVEAALDRTRAEVGRSSTPASRELQSFDRLFAGEDGKIREVEMMRRYREFPRRVNYRLLPHDLGYVEVTGFGPEIERDFELAMRSLSATRGLILDLRHNGGGLVRTVARVAGHFFLAETSLGEFIGRDGERAPRRTERRPDAYRRPLVVLLSARSASGAEMLAAALQEERRALLLGTSATTCGCLLGISRTLRLPDGGRLNISDTDYRTGRGRRIEGRGLEPDERLELRVEDLFAGRDRALELAVARLNRLAPQAIDQSRKVQPRSLEIR